VADHLKVTPSDKPAQHKQKADKPETEDKFKSLLAFGKKNGLCYKCGEKWGHNHKCPPQVSLHVVEEMLDALEHDSEPDIIDSDEEVENDIVMSVGDSTAPLPLKRRTMKLHGKVGHLDVLILVDSGSVATFISDKLSQQLQTSMQHKPAAQYLTADGTPMVCDQIISNLQWSTQGHTFTSEVGVLPLKCYDMILGEDWLESCSPMWVH
jgi:hypothetical protein